MSESNGGSAGCGIGPCGVVFIVFLVLKLIGVIDWSWLWVTAPLWGPVGILAVVGIPLAIIAKRLGGAR